VSFERRAGVWRVNGERLDERIEGQRDLVALNGKPVIPPSEVKFCPAIGGRGVVGADKLHNQRVRWWRPPPSCSACAQEGARFSPQKYTEGIFGIIDGPETRVELLLLNADTEPTWPRAGCTRRSGSLSGATGRRGCEKIEAIAAKQTERPQGGAPTALSAHRPRLPLTAPPPRSHRSGRSLEKGGSAHAATDAHANHAVAGFATLHLV
jgi:hypothetical protein